MDAIVVLRALYLVAAFAVLFVAVTPPLRDRFLAYGPRGAPASPLPPSTTPESTPSSRTAKKKAAAQSKKEVPAKRDILAAKQDETPISPGPITKFLDVVATWSIPHSYFWTFYFFSTFVSIYWLVEAYFKRGPAYRAIAERTAPRETYMTFEQLKFTWILLTLKNAWRFNEYMALPRSTSRTGKTVSKMWIGHWLLGVMFYVLTNVAVWIEGVPTLNNHEPSTDDLAFGMPSFRTIISILIFILVSGFQSDCHSYLARLKYLKPKDGREDEHGYKVPAHHAFQSLIAPHYTAECILYFSLALIAAPEGDGVNWTLLCALVFVMVNLGVTARGTKQWYQEKFGRDAVKDKWVLLPSIY